MKPDINENINYFLNKKINTNTFTVSDLKGSSFWSISSFKAVNSIFCKNKEDRILYGSRLDHLNDNAEVFGIENPDRVFILCFTQNRSIHQIQLPMWYIYGGLDGKGVSFGITPTGFCSLIRDEKQLFVGIKKEDGTIKKTDITLSKEDFSIQYGWVFYYHIDQINNSHPNQKALVRNTIIPLTKKNDLDKTAFKKSRMWNYENEFRFVINLNDSGYDKLKDIKDGEVKIGISLGKVQKKHLRIAFGPNFEDQKKMNEICREFGKRMYISEFKDVKLNLVERAKEIGTI